MKRLTAAVLVFAVSIAAFAQVPSARKLPTNVTPTGAPAQMPSKNWLKTPIDPSITAFPAQFNGVNTEEVVAWAEKATVPRGEFETSEVYQAKVSALSRQPITGSIAPGDLMAFVFKIPEYFVKYDADSQNFKIDWTPSPLRDGAKVLGPSYTVSSRNEQSTYVGSNAYGAKTDIAKIEVWSTQLLTAKPLGGGKISANFAAPLDQAPAIKESLAFAYLTRISIPSVLRVNSVSRPTRDSPRDMAMHYTVLRADIEQVVIFNQATGQIFARVGE